MSGFSVADNETNPRNFAIAIQQLFCGRSNGVGTVTLATGAASTTVTPANNNAGGVVNCGPNSKVFLFPTTAHGAAEIAAGGCYISAVAKQSFTITHANNALADRAFFYVCLG